LFSPRTLRTGQRRKSGNSILDAIASREFAWVRDLLDVHPLRTRETLQDAGDPTDYVYFPTNGIISVLAVIENGMMIEFATVGREGTTGVPAFLGLADSSMALISQVPGECLRLKSADFLSAIASCPSFRSVLRRYSGVLLALGAQSVACNQAHHMDARCARWLLMTHDQAEGDRFPITHAFLARMLGVRRPSVTAAAASLQEAGLISYHRGTLTVRNRRGLERAACECYGVVHRHFRRLRERHPE
jgi:CRP-like cAMP-binding protein